MAENKHIEAKINQTLVLKTILQNIGISRIRIAEELGLNRSTITHIVNDLLRRGLIQEVPSHQNSPATGGRKPIGLGINGRAGALLGVEWQNDFLRYVLMDFSGTILYSNREECMYQDVAFFKINVKRIVEELEGRTGICIKGIGIGIPGRVDPFKGLVLQSLPMGLQDYPLGNELEVELNIPVLIENDANCFAWGEIRENCLVQKNILCLMLEFHNSGDDSFSDQEIGMGIVQSGQVYYGSHYSSGELKSSLVPFEQSKNFLKLIRRNDNHLFEGSEKEEQTVREYMNSLFLALIPIISVLDPEKVVLGGEFCTIPSYITEILNRIPEMPEWSFSTRREYEVAYGSAGHFMEILFTAPVLEEKNRNKPVFWDRVFSDER